MKKISTMTFKKESGITLVEVLASIVILSIVLLLFLSIFLQFMNTSRKSEEVITATYLAQTEMESIYQMSRDVPFSNLDNHLQNNGYSKIGTDEQWNVFEKVYNDQYTIEAKFKETEMQLIRVIVVVHDASNSRSKTQMENLFEWKVLGSE